MTINKIKIKKINQRYLHNIIKKYPKIASGRKNYKSHYERVIRNIYLAQTYFRKKLKKF